MNIIHRASLYYNIFNRENPLHIVLITFIDTEFSVIIIASIFLTISMNKDVNEHYFYI